MGTGSGPSPMRRGRGQLASGGGGGGEPPADTEDPIYVQATVSHEGRAWPAVGMRFKGNSSLSQAWSQGMEKLPFRLHFDYWEDDVPSTEDQRFYGFKELKFGNGFNDDSLVRDKLMSDLLYDAGVPVARSSFAEIWVDSGSGPELWGLYTMYEDTCGELLDSWFGDDDGSCYKADGTSADLQTFTASAFEDKTNDSDAADVEAFISVLNEGSGPAWRAELEEHFDVQGFLWAFAINNLAGNWDTYGQMTHNYYLYADPAQNRLVWVPWDFGLAWSAANVRTPNSLMMDEAGEEWPLIRRLLDDSVYRAEYEANLEELHGGLMAPSEVMARAEELQATIRDLALQEEAPYTCRTGDFDEALYEADDAVNAWVEEASSQL